MNALCSVGIDIAAETYSATCLTATFEKVFYARTFQQTQEGWQQLLDLLQAKQIATKDLYVVMEATGVYSERISYYLYSQGIAVFVEPPQKVKQAFYERGKTDPIDSRQIAEYGFRFRDQLHPWQPKDEIVDQVHVLLTTREHLTKINTACKTTLRSLERKQRSMDTVTALYQTIITEITAKIEAIDREINETIKTNPSLHQTTSHIISIPNIGRLLAINLLVVTDGFTRPISYQSLASYIGVCPFEYTSGTSIKRRSRSDKAGPARLRKLLYLASMRLKRNDPTFQQYFARKVAEGKPKRLILNNIANKTLKIICGVVRSGKPYIKDYRSVDPNLLKG